LPKKNLQILEEKLLSDSALTKVQQYIKLYQSNEAHDVIMRFENSAEIRAHKIVLLQSPYFERAFQNLKGLPNEPISILMPEYLRVNSFKKVLRYMYHAEIDSQELEVMDLMMAREILLTAYALRLYGLMSTVLVRTIIPKMDKPMCIEFLKDSFNREDKKSKLIWKTLQHYCLNFFALHSKSILNKFSKLLEGVHHDLIFRIVSKALTKCCDIQHMYELLSLLVQNGFASNLLDILEKVPSINESDRKFDTKYIHNAKELLRNLDPKSCYLTDLIVNRDSLSAIGAPNSKRHLINSILEENKSDSSAQLSPSSAKSQLSNHLELNLKHDPNNFSKFNEWPEATTLDPVYEMKIQLPVNGDAKNKSIVSQLFDSDSRSWRLVLDVEEDFKISAFLMEKGNPSHNFFGGPFKNEFTSVKFLVQIQNAGNEHQTLLFHTFANDHHYSVGHRKFASLPNLAFDNTIHVKVWMTEFPIYSCAIQYISTRFNDILKATFQDQDVSNIITVQADEKNFLGTKQNHLNQPKYKTGPQCEEKRLRGEANKRKSINFLEDNFFRTATSNRILAHHDNQSSADPLAAHAIHPLQTHPRTEINRIPNLTAAVKNTCPPKRFEELNPYDFYYLVSSDYLTIEHEKFLLYFFYKYALKKSDQMVSLISFGLRFSFIELPRLFNAARDVHPVRNNITFIHKLDYEINMRISSNKPTDRPRKFYSAEMYLNWNFKDDLMRWLIESDHHQGYRLKIDELKKIIKSKEDQLKQAETILSDMDLKMRKIDLAVSQHTIPQGAPTKLNPFIQEALLKRSQQQQQQQREDLSVLTLVKDKCNIF